MQISKGDITRYNEDGAIILRGFFSDWISTLKRGAEYNKNNPSKRALFHNKESSTGTMLEDFCNWQRIKEYSEFVNNSNLARISAELMQSDQVQFFHDHYLHKYSDSKVATPWHQDMPYYFIKGDQTVSFWIPLEKRKKEFSLICALGSHKLSKYIRPTSWSTKKSFYQDNELFMDLPDMDKSNFKIKQWSIEPGDAVAFNYKLIHSAKENTMKTETQTLSMRLIGDDARYQERPGRTSPNFENINQKDGDKLRQDWFPIVYSK
jgi:ectoine hydroxylase-related dioxygenase (phytanoyl-CoA dioxygenase family)